MLKSLGATRKYLLTKLKRGGRELADFICFGIGSCSDMPLKCCGHVSNT